MKSILVSLFCLSSFFSFSQMTLKKLDGSPINNNDVIVFSSAVDPDSYLGIKVFNTSSSAINVRIKCESISNADGSNVQLCFGDICVSNITPGNSYPNNPSIIEGNSSNGNFDHFLNNNTGNSQNQPINYVFKFYQVSVDGVEIGNSVTFTYRYSPVLSTIGFNKLEDFGISLKNTLVTNSLEISTLKTAALDIYDLNGKLITDQKLIPGNHVLDLSHFSNGVYILNFKTEQGKASSKIIKQ